MIIVFAERPIKQQRSVPGQVTETSGSETSDRRSIYPVHPGFFPFYVRRVSVRLAPVLPAAEPEDTRTQSRDLTLNPAAGEFHRIPEATSLTESTVLLCCFYTL